MGKTYGIDCGTASYRETINSLTAADDGSTMIQTVVVYVQPGNEQLRSIHTAEIQDVPRDAPRDKRT